MFVAREGVIPKGKHEYVASVEQRGVERLQGRNETYLTQYTCDS